MAQKTSRRLTESERNFSEAILAASIMNDSLNRAHGVALEAEGYIRQAFNIAESAVLRAYADRLANEVRATRQLIANVVAKAPNPLNYSLWLADFGRAK